MKHVGNIEGNLVVQPGDDCTELVGVAGNMRITRSAHCLAPKLETVVGGVRVHDDAQLDAPALTSIGSKLDLGMDAAISAARLNAVGGAVTASADSMMDAPRLAFMAGDLSVCSAEIRLFSLIAVGGDLQFEDQGSTDLPSLRSVDGNVHLAIRSATNDTDPVISVPKLSTVGGTMGFGNGTCLDAPELTRVHGSIDLGESTALNAPSLVSVGGNLDACRNVRLTAPSLTVVSGSINIHPDSAVDLPSLISGDGERNIDEGGSLRAPTVERTTAEARERTQIRSIAKGPQPREQADPSADRLMEYALMNGAMKNGESSYR